ncbi:heavy metal-associated isoprenylated plant protein 46-like isoform X2 [Bidens hawaiensis]|uniref:heavy metal-associated isoprenylated plant protein 46-like isoform X2 n=1 Tax=Bidens hawaiensis TaxID=980011 RepID=UPI00404A5D1B
MEKQKIVVKVTMTSSKKTRTALQIVVSVSGVESASLVWSDKDQITVTGAGIDSAKLTTLLRKKVGYTELLSVGPVEEKKPEPKPTEAPLQLDPYHHYYHNYGIPYYYPVY